MIMVGDKRQDLIARMLSHIMLLFKEKKLSAVSPITAWPLLQSGKALGKVVLCPGEEEMVKVGFVTPFNENSLLTNFYKVLPQKRSLKLVSWASCILVSGCGGVGRSIAQLLVERGARHLIILSRNAQSHRHVEFIATCVQQAVTSWHEIVTLSTKQTWHVH